MRRHKKIRIVIDLDLNDPISQQDILPFVARSLAAYPPGQGSYSALPLDAPAKEPQEGFDNALFGSTHLSRGVS